MPAGIEFKIIFLLLVYIAYAISAWFIVLSLEERLLVLSYLKQVQVPN
jgi:hypothetical protein